MTRGHELLGLGWWGWVREYKRGQTV